MNLARIKAVLALFDNVTVKAPTAGKARNDASRNASYDSVRRGELPVVRGGRKIEVPTAPIREELGLTTKTDFLRMLGFENEADLTRMLEQLEQTQAGGTDHAHRAPRCRPGAGKRSGDKENTSSKLRR